MRNILSLKPGTPILGSEIREWCEYHSSKSTSHSKIAKYLREKFPDIQDRVYYELVLSPNGTGCGQKNKNKPILIRCDYMNKPDLRRE